MKYWRASRAGNEWAERAKLRAKVQLGSLGSLVNEPIFGIFLRAVRARTLAQLVRDFPLAARPARLDANPGGRPALYCNCVIEFLEVIGDRVILHFKLAGCSSDLV